MNYPAYVSYQPSGVPWIGDVPESWAVTHLRFLVRKNDGGVWGDEDDEENGVVVLRSTEQTVGGGWKIENPAKRRLSARDEAATRLATGDLLITKSSGSAQHIGKTSLVTPEVESLHACFSNFMQRLRLVDSFDPKLAFYFLNSPIGREQMMFGSDTTTGLANLTAGTLGDLLIAVPPKTEQCTIAAFLDAETAKIDTLIEKKRELIERLKEKRTALISRTVTCGLPPEAAIAAGLDPHPKLKPSGVEWLGEIPAHWEVRPFRRVISRLDQGWSPNAASYPAEPDEWAVLKLSAVSRGRFHPGQNKALEEEPEFAVCTPDTGDLLISRSNTPQLVGEVCVVNSQYPMLILPDLIYRIKIDTLDATPHFLAWFLLSPAGRAQIEADAHGSSGSMVKLSQGQVRSWVLPIPPLEEQSPIAEYLKCETDKIEKMIDRIFEAMMRLNEYRSALITSAVTGKIDVRGYVP